MKKATLNPNSLYSSLYAPPPPSPPMGHCMSTHFTCLNSLGWPHTTSKLIDKDYRSSHFGQTLTCQQAEGFPGLETNLLRMLSGTTKWQKIQTQNYQGKNNIICYPDKVIIYATFTKLFWIKVIFPLQKKKKKKNYCLYIIINLWLYRASCKSLKL